MIRSISFSQDGSIQEGLTIQQMKSAITQEENLLWVHLANPTQEETKSILSDLFSFHPLTIEDCQSLGYQPPKVDDFIEYLFIIMHAVQSDHDSQKMDTNELNIFLGSNYLVTFHQEDSLTSIENIYGRLKRDSRIHQFGTDFLCHAILDVVVDEYFPILDAMDEEIEVLEDKVLETPEPGVLERILFLKHNVMELRRIVAPQRDVINRLSRDEYRQIDQQSKIYFRDIYDHLVRIQDMSESIRDLVSSALDIYLSSTSLKLNNVMKALTIVSTIFLPITFLAGIYGMNFHYMPELTWRLGYPMVWILCLLIIAFMLLFFKKRGWF
jgi:magnesium transporter